jgi:hypothetical protein
MRTALGLAALLGAAVSCHESELEPKAPENGEWVASPVEVAPAPEPAEIHTIIPPQKWVENPAPGRRTQRQSISLGFIGDEPLSETESTGPRWPWVQEPFKMGTWRWRHGRQFARLYGY